MQRLRQFAQNIFLKKANVAPQVIGAGIFVITGTAVHDFAGPAASLSFVITGTALTFTALCYAECAERIPASSGPYGYVYTQIGECAAFLIGLLLATEFTVSSAAVARGWSAYVGLLAAQLGIHIPSFLSGWSIFGGLIEVDFLAVFLVVLLSVAIATGVKESARLNTVVTGIAVVVIVVVIVAGMVLGDTDNLTPFAPHGIAGVFAGAAAVEFAFVGFDSITAMNLEATRASFNIPLGIILTMAICTTLYFLVAFSLALLVPADQIDLAAPLAVAFVTRGQRWLAIAVSVGALCALTTTILVNLMAQPRVWVEIARDGLVPEWLAKIHQSRKTPINAILFTAIVANVFVIFFDLTQLTQLVAIATLAIFSLVNSALLMAKSPHPTAWKHVCGFVLATLVTAFVVRYADSLVASLILWAVVLLYFLYFFRLFYFSGFVQVRPEVPLNFELPGGPVIPLIGLLLNTSLMALIPLRAWVYLVVYLFLGIVFYFAYSFPRSALRQIQGQEEFAEVGTQFELVDLEPEEGTEGPPKRGH